jgi:hypothetical protein
MEIVNDIVQEAGKLNVEATKLLMMRALEPFGLWKTGQSNPETDGVRNGDNQGLMELASRYGLTVDGAKIKMVKKVEDFKTLCNAMEKHGYEYMKGKGMFLPKWEGIKQ